MIRVMANTINPKIENMNRMIGKTYTDYYYHGTENQYVTIENSFAFYRSDVKVVESEDELFRRSLLD